MFVQLATAALGAYLHAPRYISPSRERIRANGEQIFNEVVKEPNLAATKPKLQPLSALENIKEQTEQAFWLAKKAWEMQESARGFNNLMRKADKAQGEVKAASDQLKVKHPVLRELDKGAEKLLQSPEFFQNFTKTTKSPSWLQQNADPETTQGK